MGDGERLWRGGGTGRGGDDDDDDTSASLAPSCRCTRVCTYVPRVSFVFFVVVLI